MSALRDKILDVDDLDSELVPVPEWGADVEVRSMSARARAVMMKKALQDDGTMDLEAFYPAVLVATCYDPETGEPLFTKDDESALSGKNGAAVDRLATVGMRLSGLTKDAVDQGKDGS